MRHWRHRRSLRNRRSELAAATVGADSYGYAYDTIGNRIWSSANTSTNSYAANGLNQYSSISTLRASASPRETNPSYDADGNLVRDDRFAYAYDAENRMLSARPIAPSEGDLAVVNAYDHKHRRIMKRVKRFDGDEWQTVETHTFAYDGSNIVLDRIAFADGSMRTVEYFWGNDLSGTEQGAGGVGGLLAVSIDGTYYIPCYDHNGNIVCYVSESGTIAAQYVYDPYGNVIEQYGALADRFAIRFSTKYTDVETGLISYLRRFYRPDHGRWLNRDPIEEEGGENLYAFCDNGMPYKFDVLGTSTCCRNGKKENCDKFYKWEGTVTTTSLTWGLGATFLMIDIKSNFVCMTCSRWRIHIKAVLLTASLGAPFSLTGSNIEFGNVSPDAFVGSVSLIGAGVGAMGVVEASSLRIGNAWANNVGLVGGAELGAGGAYGWFVDFEMVEE